VLLKGGTTPAAESPKLSDMNRDAIISELLELEGLLQDDRLNDHDRIALHGAAQALRHILDPDTGTRPPKHSTGSTSGQAKRCRCWFIEAGKTARGLAGLQIGRPAPI
jgi:hypothetical protein